MSLINLYDQQRHRSVYRSLAISRAEVDGYYHIEKTKQINLHSTMLRTRKAGFSSGTACIESDLYDRNVQA